MVIFLVLASLSLLAFFVGRYRAVMVSGGELSHLHSLPFYHGALSFFGCLGASCLFLVLWGFGSGWWLESRFLSEFYELSGATGDTLIWETFWSDSNSLSEGLGVAVLTPEKELAASFLSDWHDAFFVVSILGILFFGFLATMYCVYLVRIEYRARWRVERILKVILMVCSIVAIFTTIGIVLSLIFESLRFFGRVPFTNFIFGLHWSPQSAYEGIGSEVGDYSDVFGAVPVFWGTFLITLIAMSVAAPVGLMSAVYLSEYASPRFRRYAKPILEILAGVPTVVYGFFAALTVAPAFRGFGDIIGLDVASESAIAAGLVMGIMIIPFVSSLSDDVISAVPASLRDGSAGLGATKSETIRRVVLPAALSGIVSSLLLAISRAIGETMIVVMAVGLAANLTANPFDAVTTVTVQIVILLIGDQEFDSAKTLSAFALGLVLFTVTLILNIIALRVVKRYRERYD